MLFVEKNKIKTITIELVLFPSFCLSSIFLSVSCNVNVLFKLPKRLSIQGNYSDLNIII